MYESHIHYSGFHFLPTWPFLHQAIALRFVVLAFLSTADGAPFLIQPTFSFFPIFPFARFLSFTPATFLRLWNYFR